MKEKVNADVAFTFHAFHPKAVNENFSLAGLLACLLLNTFPSAPRG
jgi:hypothetical protein